MGRERSYEVAAEWTMPDLAASLRPELHVDSEIVTLTAMHFDTASRTLGREGVSVIVEPAECSVRLPADEFSTAATSVRSVPRDVQAILLGARAGERLVPIAKIDVLRNITRIVGEDDVVVARIIDDDTTATAFDDADVVDRRRTITLAASDKAVRSILHEALVASGAQRCDAGGRAPEFVVALTSLSAGAHARSATTGTLGCLVTDYLTEQHSALVHADIALRRGHDVVHSARIAIRRYRSALRVFADVFDADRTAALDAEMQWYAQQLGAVRDPQVQRARLGAAVAALPPELVLGPVAARIEQALLGEMLKARVRLDRAMRGKRYLALLADLESWRQAPPVTKRAQQRQKKAVRYLDDAHRTLAKGLRAAEHSDDESLHRARRAAKRVRYAADLAEPALGKSARRSAARAKKLQTRLGEFVDSAAAGQVLLQLARATARVSDENGFTFGLLYELERERADRERESAIKSAR
jgi:CHAD domain-containing protein